MTLPCLGGGPAVDLAALRGPLVVNLWDSYCGPCREEMPVLQEFHDQYGDRVGVLGIDYEDPQTVSALPSRRKSGRDLPAGGRPRRRAPGNGPFPRSRMGLPLFAFVDEAGHVELAASAGSDSVDAARRSSPTEHLGAGPVSDPE